MAGAATCQHHPEREAIGVCVACRTRLCGECVTKVEGINHCVACLAKLAAEGARRPIEARRAPLEANAPWAAGTYLLVLSLAAWCMLEVLLPGGQ